MPYKQVLKEIHPSEAKAIASKVNRLSQDVEEISRQVKQSGQELDRTWYGRAKTNFFSRFGLIPGKISRLSNDLSSKARRIQVMTIIVSVTEWFDDLIGRGDG